MVYVVWEFGLGVAAAEVRDHRRGVGLLDFREWLTSAAAVIAVLGTSRVGDVSVKSGK